MDFSGGIILGFCTDLSARVARNGGTEETLGGGLLGLLIGGKFCLFVEETGSLFGGKGGEVLGFCGVDGEIKVDWDLFTDGVLFTGADDDTGLVDLLDELFVGPARGGFAVVWVGLFGGPEDCEEYERLLFSNSYTAGQIITHINWANKNYTRYK